MRSIKWLYCIITLLSLFLIIASWRYTQLAKSPLSHSACDKELMNCSANTQNMRANFLNSINWDNLSLNPKLVLVNVETNNSIFIEELPKPQLILTVPQSYCESCINQQLFILKSKIENSPISILLPSDNIADAQQIRTKLAIPFTSYFMETPPPKLIQISKPLYFYLNSDNEIESPYFVEENNTNFINEYLKIIIQKITSIEKSFTK